MSFHIAGDNGVGKTYIAELFAEALFEYPQKGSLVLSGTNFIGDNQTIVECIVVTFC